jgi:hypothetical protein
MRTSHKVALLVIAVAAAIVCAAVWVVRGTPSTSKSLQGTTGAGVVTGKVLNVDDKPQPDISVQLSPPIMAGNRSAAGGGGGGAAPTYRARTDKDGQFRIEKVPGGSYRLLAGDKTIGMALKEVTVASDQTVTLNLKLRKLKT